MIGFVYKFLKLSLNSVRKIYATLIGQNKNKSNSKQTNQIASARHEDILKLS